MTDDKTEEVREQIEDDTMGGTTDDSDTVLTLDEDDDE